MKLDPAIARIVEALARQMAAEDHRASVLPSSLAPRGLSLPDGDDAGTESATIGTMAKRKKSTSCK